MSYKGPFNYLHFLPNRGLWCGVKGHVFQVLEPSDNGITFEGLIDALMVSLYFDSQ